MAAAAAPRGASQNSRRAAVPAEPVPSAIDAILRSDFGALDADAQRMLEPLHASTAPLIWHKHGSFLDHLRDVWLILSAWEQPRAWCRLGLYHSAYSNSFVSMNAFDIDTDRDLVASYVGAEAEALVYKFCVINRQELEDAVETSGVVRAQSFRHIHTGAPVELSAWEAAACVTETIADQMDQSFSWQSELEAGRSQALWPGVYAPTLRMAKLSVFARALRESGAVPEAGLPPVFHHSTTVLDADAERAARDAYVSVVFDRLADGTVAPTDGDLADLSRASALNPFVAEPHLARAQILCQMDRFDDAQAAAKQGLSILCEWATPWDKRMPLHAWVAWARCLVFQARLREWPSTHGGLESLGAIDSAQRYRDLNTDRTL